ncbi:MAG: alpha/beta fold hydrolase [Ignavibacteriales bacterium]|nr:alpha/beta fold hydrolase [Ignavibacteriales bacterium]
MRRPLSLLCFLISFCGILHHKEVFAQEGLKDINGVQLYTKVVGEGLPLVIVHGGPGLDHSYLLPQIAQLGKYYKLIFFDMRASGRSSVNIDTNSMTLDTLLEDIDGIRKSFGIDKMNLMGHSWGGFLAMQYAVKYPDRLSSLLLINTSPASSKLKDETERVAQSRMTKEDSEARLTLLRSEAFRRRDPAAMASLFRISFRGSFFEPHYADSLSLVFQPNYSASSAMLQHLFKDRALLNYDLSRRLSAVRCPTLILGGEYDQVSPQILLDLQKSILSSTLVILKHCGHFPYIERQNDFIAAVRDFLQ